MRNFCWCIGLVLTGLILPLVNLAQPSDSGPWYRFSADGRECAVLKSDLPTPWLNRLSNDQFATWITHQGFVESYLLDPLYNGLTNPQETSGRFYIRDREAGRYFQVNKPSESSVGWEARVGLGYQIVRNTEMEIRAEVHYFIPRSDDVLLMVLNITNLADRRRTLDTYGEVEWNLGDPVKHIVYRGDGRGGSQFNLYKIVRFEGNALIANQPNWRNTGNCIPWPYTGFFAVNRPVSSFETIKSNFLGVARDYDHPAQLESGRCTNTEFWSRSDYPVGVLHNELTIAPGGSAELIYVLGMTRDSSKVAELRAKYGLYSQVEAERAKLEGFYDQLTRGSVVVETPDTANDRILNIWTKYHWRQVLKRSQNNGELGLGLWSYGLEGSTIRTGVEPVILPFDQNIVRDMVINHFRNQVADTGQTDLTLAEQSLLYEDLRLPGPARNHKGTEQVTHRHKITQMFYPVYFYLLETGDLKLLDTVLPYLDGSKATVWEHIRRAMTISRRVIGPRGLPLIPAGHGDWMDEFTRISANNRAESVMLAGELGFILRGFAEIADKTGRKEDARIWREDYERMRRAVNELAWDGNWYIRAFSDRTEPFTPLGTHRDPEGQLYLNAQSWMILSGMATPDRAQASLDAVRSRLLSDFGPKIFAPSYSRYVEHVGTQSLYAPGFRNGCIYLRPTGWAIMAAVQAGRPELARELYERAALKTRVATIGQFECEPYVYPELYNGPDHLQQGRGEFQWNLGEGAAWMWYSYVYFILGVRPELDGLRIDPAIPASWEGFRMRRAFRGAILDIRVINRSGTGNGVKEIRVNGKKVKGNLLNTFSAGKQYSVVVTI